MVEPQIHIPGVRARCSSARLRVHSLGQAGRINVPGAQDRKPSNHSNALSCSLCARFGGSCKASISQLPSQGSSWFPRKRALMPSTTAVWLLEGQYCARRTGPDRLNTPSATIRVRWLFTLVAEIPRGCASCMSWLAVIFRPANTNTPKSSVRVESVDMIAITD